MPFCASSTETTSAASPRETLRSEPCSDSRKPSTFALERPWNLPGCASVCCSSAVVFNMPPSGCPRASVSGCAVRALSCVHHGFFAGSSDICGVNASSDGTRTGAACEGSPCATGVPRSLATTTKGRGRVEAYFACR